MPIAETPSDSERRYPNKYERTTLMCQQTGQLFGQDRLDSSLRTTYQRCKIDRDATTDSLLEEAESHLDPEARAFFTSFLYDPLNPVVAGETTDTDGV